MLFSYDEPIARVVAKASLEADLETVYSRTTTRHQDELREAADYAGYSVRPASRKELRELAGLDPDARPQFL